MLDDVGELAWMRRAASTTEERSTKWKPLDPVDARKFGADAFLMPASGSNVSNSKPRGQPMSLSILGVARTTRQT